MTSACPAEEAAEMRQRRLLWRCRRGMKELDLLLARFAAERYAAAPADLQQAFEDFLELPDPEIADHLLGYVAAGDPCRTALVAAILA